MWYVDNTLVHILLKTHLFIFMNIIYVCTYIYMYIHIYRYIYTVRGVGGQILNILGDFWDNKSCAKK